VPNETSYYDEICNYLTSNLVQHLGQLGDFIVNFRSCENVDLRAKLHQMLIDNSIHTRKLTELTELTKGLYVDIVGLVYSVPQQSGELIICEVKNNPLTLTHCSQLVGYCISADAPYGLLIGINQGITRGFQSILNLKPSILHIERKVGRKKMTHEIGLCKWESPRQRLLFNRAGRIDSLLDLSRALACSLNE